MERPAGISSEAVHAKTGKTWDEWFSILDKAGGRSLSHKEIVAVLNTAHKVGPWWCQMITVGYEQARGLRAAHQKTDGFSASISRTLPVPLARLYLHWSNAAKRGKWLGSAPIQVRKMTENKSVRLAWEEGASTVEVNFYAKGDAKSQVTVQHDKLKSATEVSRMKEFWAGRLAALKEELGV